MTPTATAWATAPRSAATTPTRANGATPTATAWRDGAEVKRYHTNPRKRDTDGDGLSDGAEVKGYHTNPRKRDTDGDGSATAPRSAPGPIPRPVEPSLIFQSRPRPQ